MSRPLLLENIKQSLGGFEKGGFEASTHSLFESLGYQSNRRFEELWLTPENLAEAFNCHQALRQDKALSQEWKSVHFLFQLTDDEISAAGQERQMRMVFDSDAKVDPTIFRSYLFFAVELRGVSYTRGQLAGITREINRLFAIPAMVLFGHGSALTLAIIHRRPHKREAEKDVLEKVTLIKDIRLSNPHRAHLEILADLALPELYERYHFTNFLELHQAWQDTLNISELNKRFYIELANWYFWAVKQVTFPSGAGDSESNRNSVSVIRLITRLIFVWFIREKGLVPEILFDRKKLDEVLTFNDPQESTYYKAILQNLFFATLNTEMGSSRRFRGKNQSGGMDAHHGISTVYRYEEYFRDPQVALALFADIPFLNGGLFECLDKETERNGKGEILRIDGFSDRVDNPLCVPDRLFFGERHREDLSYAFGDPRHDHEQVRGLINLLNSYKFTIEENTPIEEEIALDPELLGKVFENLLASYNPETGATARKQTGSFYTPREIVNYMVDEALVAYLETALKAQPNSDPQADSLRDLLSYNEAPHGFDENETLQLISAIDRIKTLDPACGSGAFPMGVLHKLVFILNKLDPGNQRWKERQIAKAGEIPDPAVREKVIVDIDQAFSGNELDYGRKLYLIENCIYGVDIQPIAVQIAKLRFFIALVVEQKTDPAKENLGVRPLPNLETKFVAANTLIGIGRPKQMALRNPEIDQMEKQLAEVRSALFTARTPATKRKYREKDAQLRGKLAALLQQDGWGSATADQLAAWDPYDQNASAPFFDPEWMFGVDGGFDITIGNPPYVRADSGEAHLNVRKQIESSGQYETLWEKWDLFVPFIEKSYKLLKPGGFTTLIVSDAYCHSKYAQKSQNWFLQHSRILRLDFLSKIKIFDAGIHNIVYLFQHADGSQNTPLRLLHDPEFGVFRLLPSAEQGQLNYRVFFPEEIKTQAFSRSTIRLGEICYISVGMVVHADEKVAQGAFQLEDLVSTVKDEIHSKPFVEGKDLNKWILDTPKYLEWGTTRAPELFRRKTFPELYEQNLKLMLPMVGEIRAAIDSNRLYCNHGIFVGVLWHHLAGVVNKSIKKSARYKNEKSANPNLPYRENFERNSKQFSLLFLLGFLNTSFAQNFLKVNRRNNIQLYPDDWKDLPVPDVSAEQQALVVSLVKQILDLKRADASADVSELEAEIDRQVNALYGLVEQEIVLVEGQS